MLFCFSLSNDLFTFLWNQIIFISNRFSSLFWFKQSSSLLFSSSSQIKKKKREKEKNPTKSQFKTKSNDNLTVMFKFELNKSKSLVTTFSNRFVEQNVLYRSILIKKNKLDWKKKSKKKFVFILFQKSRSLPFIFVSFSSFVSFNETKILKINFNDATIRKKNLIKRKKSNFSHLKLSKFFLFVD